jgi:hypothetical protein
MQGEGLVDSVYSIVEIDSIVLSKNSSDFRYIGYKKSELGPAFGISGMFLNGDYLYISDDCFGNIKKLNLRSKKIEYSSIILSQKYKDVGELFLFGDTLVCLTKFQDKIYFLDSNLNLISEHSAIKGGKEFVEMNGKVYISFLLDRSKIMTLDLNLIDNDAEYTRFYDFKITDCNSSVCLRNRYGFFHLEKEIPTSISLEVNNVVFDKQRIVSLYEDESNYFLVVLTYSK